MASAADITYEPRFDTLKRAASAKEPCLWPTGDVEWNAGDVAHLTRTGEIVRVTRVGEPGYIICVREVGGLPGSAQDLREGDELLLIGATA